MFKNLKQTTDPMLSHLRSQLFLSYGPCFAQRSQTAISSDYIERYEALLIDLISAGFVFRTARDIHQGNWAQKTVWLRHDIDIDIETAVKMAHVEHELGVSATYYILHTAPYFVRDLDSAPFDFYPKARDMALQIQNLGHEVGIHTDPLSLYLYRGIDGARHLTEAIYWLREGGLEITGSVSHNSASTYGAENSSIFRGRPLKKRGAEFSETLPNHPSIPLGVLDENSLGLTYEGNDPFPEMPSLYYAIRSTNLWRTSGEGWGIWKTQTELLGEAAQRSSGYLILSVHPVYFGARQNASSEPYRTDNQELSSGFRRSAVRPKPDKCKCSIWTDVLPSVSSALHPIHIDKHGLQDFDAKLWNSSSSRLAVVDSSRVLPRGVFSLAHLVQTMSSCGSGDSLAAFSGDWELKIFGRGEHELPTHVVAVSGSAGVGNQKTHIVHGEGIKLLVSKDFPVPPGGNLRLQLFSIEADKIEWPREFEKLSEPIREEFGEADIPIGPMARFVLNFLAGAAA